MNSQAGRLRYVKSGTIENPAAQGALIPTGKALHGITPLGLQEKPWRDCPGGIDFNHPDFAMSLRMTEVNTGPSRFYYSTNRGHGWEGLFRLPLEKIRQRGRLSDGVSPLACGVDVRAGDSSQTEGSELLTRWKVSGPIMLVRSQGISSLLGNSCGGSACLRLIKSARAA